MIVNRLWAHHFGRGIVATPSDFGLQGERPSHPELLDWLARELIAKGWSMKHLHRLMVTSQAYRQGMVSVTGKAIDPDNKLLGRRTARRLEAEAIRDAILAVSGRLDRRMYGPGTLDAGHTRRSIYFFVKRSQLIPMMVLFDAPDALQGAEGRTTTTIAPQALLLMNNETVRASARLLADRLRESAEAKKNPEALVRAASLLILGRPPTPSERAEGLSFLREQEVACRAEKIAEPERQALTDYCQVLLGLNEFVYVD